MHSGRDEGNVASVGFDGCRGVALRGLFLVTMGSSIVRVFRLFNCGILDLGFSCGLIELEP